MKTMNNKTKLLLLVIAALTLTLSLSSCRDARYSIQKSIHITDRGDTIVSYGGALLHFEDNTYRLVEAE